MLQSNPANAQPPARGAQLTSNAWRRASQAKSQRPRRLRAWLALCLTGQLLLGGFGISPPITRASRAAAPPTLTPAQIEAAVEEYFVSVASFDVQRYANNFTTNGVLEDPVGTPPLEGQQAIAAFYAAGIAALSEIRPTVQEVVAGGNEAAVKWRLKVKTKTGKQIKVEGIGVFKFNAAGKLLLVREFWDVAAFLAQLP